jgi:hypothetical protein
MRPARDERTPFNDRDARRVLRSGRLDQLKLGQRGHAVVEANLLDDLAVDHLQHCGTALFSSSLIICTAPPDLSRGDHRYQPMI